MFPLSASPPERVCYLIVRKHRFRYLEYASLLLDRFNRSLRSSTSLSCSFQKTSFPVVAVSSVFVLTHYLDS